MASDPTNTPTRPRVSRKAAAKLAASGHANGILGATNPGKPLDWKRIFEHPEVTQQVARKISSDSARYLETARNVFLDAAPHVAIALRDIALGRVRSATVADRVGAAKLVLAHAGIDQGPGANLTRANLTELSLDQLETLLTGALGAVRDAQAIESTAIEVPVTGTAGLPSEPDPTGDQAAGQAPDSSAAGPAGGGGEVSGS